MVTKTQIIMHEAGAKSKVSLSFAHIGPVSCVLLLSFLGRGIADYVETAPRPVAPLPPAIPYGECPLVFLQPDIQHAKQSACSSSESSKLHDLSLTMC